MLPDNNCSPAIMADSGLLRGRLCQVDTARKNTNVNVTHGHSNRQNIHTQKTFLPSLTFPLEKLFFCSTLPFQGLFYPCHLYAKQRIQDIDLQLLLGRVVLMRTESSSVLPTLGYIPIPLFILGQGLAN